MRHPTAGLAAIEGRGIEDTDIKQIHVRKAITSTISRRADGYSSSSRKVGVRWS